MRTFKSYIKEALIKGHAIGNNEEFYKQYYLTYTSDYLPEEVEACEKMATYSFIRMKTNKIYLIKKNTFKKYLKDIDGDYAGQIYEIPKKFKNYNLLVEYSKQPKFFTKLHYISMEDILDEENIKEALIKTNAKNNKKHDNEFCEDYCLLFISHSEKGLQDKAEELTDYFKKTYKSSILHTVVWDFYLLKRSTVKKELQKLDKKTLKIISLYYIPTSIGSAELTKYFLDSSTSFAKIEMYFKYVDPKDVKKFLNNEL